MIEMREKYFPQIEKFSQLEEEANLTKNQWEIIEKKRREILPPNWKVPNDPLLDFERHFDRVAVNLNEKLKHSSILHIYRRATTAWHLQLVIAIIFWRLSKFLHPFPEGSRQPSHSLVIMCISLGSTVIFPKSEMAMLSTPSWSSWSSSSSLCIVGCADVWIRQSRCCNHQSFSCSHFSLQPSGKFQFQKDIQAFRIFLYF